MDQQAYQRIEEVGSGGIGTVYRGRQMRLDREVAVKEIREVFNVFAQIDRQDIVDRFQDIVETQASLRHPNIIHVIDIDTDVEFPFSVMEYAPRGNLRRIIDQDDPPELNVVLQYFLQILHALHNAHDQGVIHGNLKPENVVLDHAGNALVTDFGLSDIIDSQAGSQNQVFVGVGSVAYMSPEQLKDPNLVSEKSDMYSLGIMFYEMLTGEVPGRRSPMPSELFEEIPTVLDDIFDRMSIDDESQRYDSVDEIIEELYGSQEVVEILDERSAVLFLDDPSGDAGMESFRPTVTDDSAAVPAGSPASAAGPQVDEQPDQSVEQPESPGDSKSAAQSAPVDDESQPVDDEDEADVASQPAEPQVAEQPEPKSEPEVEPAVEEPESVVEEEEPEVEPAEQSEANEPGMGVDFDDMGEELGDAFDAMAGEESESEASIADTGVEPAESAVQAEVDPGLTGDTSAEEATDLSEGTSPDPEPVVDDGAESAESDEDGEGDEVLDKLDKYGEMFE